MYFLRNRRLPWRFFSAAVLAAFATGSIAPSAHAENGVTATEILLGQSTALSGPLAELGSDSAIAAKAYFDYVNVQGGVHGRKLRLITLDDGYNTARGVENVRTLIEKEHVFALFNVIGTPANIELLPVIAKAGIPNIAPFSGSQALRQPFNRLVFNVRASYADETEKIIEHLGVRGLKKIGVVYQNNAMGLDGLVGVEIALSKRGQQVLARAPIENDASDAANAASRLYAAKLQAVIMITAGKPSVEFVRAYNKLDSNMPFFTLSVMGTQTSVKALGKDGVGVVVAQVAPFPFSATSGVVSEFQKVMRQMGVDNWSFTKMEGFLNAKVMVEGLRRAGPNLTRERLINAMESINRLDFDGYMVNFTDKDHAGSRYVELTVISKDGRFLR